MIYGFLSRFPQRTSNVFLRANEQLYAWAHGSSAFTVWMDDVIRL